MYRITAFLNKLKTCGLHYYPQLPSNVQETVRAVVYKTADHDSDYDSDCDANCIEESDNEDAEPYVPAKMEGDFVFVYKAKSKVKSKVKTKVKAVIRVDFDRYELYLDIDYLQSTVDLIALLRQLIGRFKHINCFVIDQMPSSSRKEVFKVLSTINFIHVVFHEKAVYMIRKHNICDFVDGVLRKSMFRFRDYYGKQGDCLDFPHTQHIQMDHKNDVMYLTLDPPIFYKTHNGGGCDLPLELCCEAAKTHILPDYCHHFPRFNKLVYCMRDSHNWNCKGVCLPTSHALVRKLILPMSMSDSIYPTRLYKEEMTEFINYAKNVRAYVNGKALIIQRAWRRAISDPTYTLCRRRLLNEIEELSAI